MDDLTGFPKYQYSVFLKNGRDEQMVIRSNDWEEFKTLKTQIDTIMGKRETKQLEVEPENQELPMCTIHNKPMKQRTGADGDIFYSHAFKTKEGNWLYCSGRGFNKK